MARPGGAPPSAALEGSRQATARNAPLIATLAAPAQPRGIGRLQERFRGNADRLEHWAADRRVPADNTLAARDRRPTVSARNVRFGAQSEAGAHTRGSVMSVLPTLTKRQVEVVAPLKRVLDPLAIANPQDPFPHLFPTHAT
jgi:transposase